MTQSFRLVLVAGCFHDRVGHTRAMNADFHNITIGFRSCPDTLAEASRIPNVCYVNNRSWTKCRGQERISSRARSVLNCSSGVGNWRRGVTCLNCDSAPRGDLSEQRHSRRGTVANLSPLVPFRESKPSLCFGTANASVRALWENELDFTTSAFERLIDLATRLRAVLSVG
jgi:hypothetical protein